jgi:hypothetical protein
MRLKVSSIGIGKDGPYSLILEREDEPGLQSVSVHIRELIPEDVGIGDIFEVTVERV